MALIFFLLFILSLIPLDIGNYLYMSLWHTKLGYTWLFHAFDWHWYMFIITALLIWILSIKTWIYICMYIYFPYIVYISHWNSCADLEFVNKFPRVYYLYWIFAFEYIWINIFVIGLHVLCVIGRILIGYFILHSTYIGKQVFFGYFE